MEKNGYNQGKYRGKEEKRDKSVMEKHNNQVEKKLAYVHYSTVFQSEKKKIFSAIFL